MPPGLFTIHKDAGDAVVVGNVLQHLELIAVFGDRALDRNAGDLLFACQRRQLVVAERQRADRDNDSGKPGRAPQRDRAAKPAAVENCFRFEHWGCLSVSGPPRIEEKARASALWGER